MPEERLGNLGKATLAALNKALEQYIGEDYVEEIGLESSMSVDEFIDIIHHHERLTDEEKSSLAEIVGR